MKPALLLLIVAVTSLSWSQSAPGTGDTKIEVDEYQIYASVVDFLHEAKLAKEPVIARQTSTFECSMGCNGMNIGGCNGLRGNDETPEERLRIVKKDLPAIQQTTASDFLRKNQQCSSITGHIPTDVQYVTFTMTDAGGKPAAWGHPDYFYFSRVAFNLDHSQALVHVSFMSGTNGSDSGGKYWLFAKKNGQWKRVGSSAVWEFAPQ